VKEEHWNRCFIAATGGSLPENMLLGRKKLILLPTVVVARTLGKLKLDRLAEAVRSSVKCE
jgi:hypothetical protein